MMIKFFTFMLLIAFSSNILAGAEEIIQKLVDSKKQVDTHAKLVDETIEEGRPLTGEELYQISTGARQRLLNREESYQFISKDFTLVQKRIKKDYTINDQDLSSLIGSLAVALTLYETTLYTYHQFQDRPKLRRLLNEKDRSFKREDDTFKDSLKSLFSVKNSLHLLRAIKIYKRFYLTNENLMADSRLQIYSKIIEGSYFFNHFKSRDDELRDDVFTILFERLKISLQAKVDFFNHLGNAFIYKGSKIFGNLVGGIQKRKGLLYKDDTFMSKVEETWKPMDIILEKTPFRATDRFIPGFWGHAAIYLGTREDLERLGIWENELVQKYASQIEDGKIIVEALRDKVQINTLEHFSDIDDFALMRSRVAYTDQELAEHILRALSHVGKKYDFNFDVETGDTIVCSELHYRTFTDLKFNTTLYLGRYTISVDQVAEQALQGMPFAPILLYINGEEIDQEETEMIFNNLLKTPTQEQGKEAA